MNRLLSKLNRIIRNQLLRSKKKKFKQQIVEFRELNKEGRFDVRDEDIWAFYDDATITTAFEPHYTYHPAWAMRVVKQINPKKHIDISSLLSFSTHLSTFIPVEFYDYRPAAIKLPNLVMGAADLNNLPFETNSIESLSCMHTIEHIGLGRYGDKLDPDGDIKAAKELSRVVKHNGHLIFVTPVGKPKLQFNSQRIYSFEMITKMFADFELKEFSMVNDSKELIFNADPLTVANQSYGCGCFWFIKK